MTTVSEPGRRKNENSSNSDASGHGDSAAPPSSRPGGDEVDIQSTDSVQNYLRDIRLMLDHCRSRGILIPAKTEKSIALVYSERSASGSPGYMAALVQLHGQLSQLVAPATPSSLAATTFSFRQKGSRGTSFFIIGMLAAAAIGIVGYLVTLSAESGEIQPEPKQNSPAKTMYALAVSVMPMADTPRPAGSGAPRIWSPNSTHRLVECLNYLFAAMVGSAFYSLLTAYGYLRRRTFDPSYLPTYLIRFVLGILAGVVLASFFGAEVSRQSSSTLAKLGPGVFALLGGYSAEAVRLIMDRFVEVLVTAVQGRDVSDEQRRAVAKDVLSIAQAASADQSTPEEVKTRLDTLLKKLQH